MNKKLIRGGALVVVVLVGVYLFGLGGGGGVIGETITITQFQSGETINSSAMVSVPFLEARDSARVSVALDLNGDGTYGDEETVISNVPIRAQKDWKNGFYFTAGEGLEGVTTGQVTVDGEVFDVAVVLKTQDVGSLLELETITDPENAMKGIGTAYAQTDVEISNDDVPDINQKPGECAPTSAANGLIDLVRENGSDDQQLGDPGELIEDLKEHMGWTRANGVLPDDFVAGKNAWAAANSLPIVTKKVGDANGISTVDDIRDALENGDAVEIRIKFANAGGTSVVGGHMVTVTGIHQDGDETHLDINDPATEDSGTESVEVSGNTFSNYGPWDGITVMSWGFTQTWTGPVVSAGDDSTGVSLEEEEDTGVAVDENGTAGSIGDELIGGEPLVEISFNHTKPGEYSEIYVSVVVDINNVDVTATLKGPGVSGYPTQVVTSDDNGQAYFVWKINAFGTYFIEGDAGGITFGNEITVN